MPSSPLLRLLALPGLQIGSFLFESWSAMRGQSPVPDVPPMEASLRSVGEAVLDRSFTLGVNLLTGVPNPAEVRAGQARAAEARDFVRDRGWLVDPAGFHRAPPAISVASEERESAGRGWRKLEFSHLSFESGYQPWEGFPGAEAWAEHEPNRTAHAYVMEHAGRDRPWLVCVHGFGMGTPKSLLPAFAARKLHEELGLNLIFPVLPLHGLRASGRVSGGDLLQPDMTTLLHIFAQAVWDIRRVIGWLRGRGSQNIGLYGISLGGYTSALVSALEPGLECVIAGIPPCDMSSVARDNEPWLMRRMERDLNPDWQLVRELMWVVSPLAFDPLVPRDRRFLYAGIADRVVQPEQARALWRHWQRPRIHWFPGGHVASQFRDSVTDFVVDALRVSSMGEQERAAA